MLMDFSACIRVHIHLKNVLNSGYECRGDFIRQPAQDISDRVIFKNQPSHAIRASVIYHTASDCGLAAYVV